jgi:hypothetical protein
MDPSDKPHGPKPAEAMATEEAAAAKPHPAADRERPKAIAGDHDEHGDPFDPEQHEPRWTADGHWRTKRGAGAADAHAKAQLDDVLDYIVPEKLPDSDGEDAEDAADVRSQQEAIGEIMAAFMADTSLSLIDLAANDGRESSDHERRLTFKAYKSYLATTNLQPPPLLLLGLTLGGIYAKRVRSSGRARGRLKWFTIRTYMWTRGLWARIRGRFKR